MGRGYVIEHCISSLKLNNEEKAFKIYVTDALMAIANNTTHIVGAQGVVDYGMTITQRWIELNSKPSEPEKPEDNRSSEEIAVDMWNRIRGR